MLMRLVLIAGLALVASTVPVAARAPRDGRQTVAVDGQDRVFYLHLPPAYDGTTPLPLVVVLHGGGGNGPRIARQTDFETKADAEGFVVVFPNGQDVGNGKHYWNAGRDTSNDPEKAKATGDDVAFIDALIGQLVRELAIDQQRIYVTGFSNGASMTHQVACALSDRIVAVAAVSSGLSVACDPTSPVSVLQMNGSDDPHFTDETIEVGGQQVGWWYAISFWSEFNACSAEPVVETVGRVTTETHQPCADGTEVVRITLEGVGHNWPGGPAGPDDPVSATDVVWDFFARHAHPAPATPVAAA
jgi:polyhydroxybutyrate depolymerase